MSKKIVIVTMLFIVMSGIGCVHELRKENYILNCATDRQLEMDSAECEREAEEKVHGSTVHYNRFFDSCMRLKGYRRIR